MWNILREYFPMKWLLRIKVSEGANEKLRQWSTLYTCSKINWKRLETVKRLDNEQYIENLLTKQCNEVT